MLVDASTGSSEEPRALGSSTAVVIAAALPSELPRAPGWTSQREKLVLSCFIPTGFVGSLTLSP